MKKICDNIENIPLLKVILDTSTLSSAQYLAASALKNLLGENWLKIPVQEKVNIKDYLLNFLANKGMADKSVTNMIILLLSKISKLSWFDHPEL